MQTIQALPFNYWPSPLLGGRTRCVVSLMTSLKSSSSRMSIPVEEATLAPSAQRDKWKGSKRDGASNTLHLI